MSSSMKSHIQHQQLEGRMRYFNSVRDVKGFRSVWDIDEIDDLAMIVPLKNQYGRQVSYQYIPEDVTWDEICESNREPYVEISTKCEGTTYMDLWEAAERLIVQANTHHRYIEDFTMRDDGSLELITGS